MVNFSAVLIVVAGLVFSIVTVTDYQAEQKKNKELVIGVLSSRQNVVQRNTLRKTWAGYAQHNIQPQVQVWFIIGQPCLVPPADRLSTYSCEHANTTHTGLGRRDLIFASVVHPKLLGNLKEFKIYPGLSFRVFHSILVNRLGVLKSQLPDNGQAITVVLENPLTQDILATVNISSKDYELEKGGYIYKSVPSLLLANEFEGQVLVFEYVTSEATVHTAAVEWNTGGNAVVYTQFMDDISINQVKKFNGEAISLVSFVFTIFDPGNVLEHVSGKDRRAKEWMEKVDNESRQLHAEQLEHGDIIMVDSIDTYRNLPAKLLAFYHWLISAELSFNYVLKTDDDTMLDVRGILQMVGTIAFQNTSRIWWGNFRESWMVYRHGKWAELDYPSTAYPAFACGSGYVLSRSIVQWLVDNRDWLHLYQGEDVSMGIWLAALCPERLQDNRWECTDSCSSRSLSRAQLSPEMIMSSWDTLQVCLNLCECL